MVEFFNKEMSGPAEFAEEVAANQPNHASPAEIVELEITDDEKELEAV